MADLDTRNKRASAIAFDFGWGHVYPNPDGTIGQADRQQTGTKYPGILSSDGGAGGSVLHNLPLMGVG